MRRAAALCGLLLGLGCSSEEAGHPRSEAPATAARAPVASAEPGAEPTAAPSPQPASSAPGGPAASAVAPAPQPPAELVKLLAPTPYVEDKCEPVSVATFAGAARRCRYQVMGVAAEVVVANPDADRVARWIVDAAAYAAPLEAIRERDPAAWTRGVLAFARHVRRQSSRIFPIEGEIVEDLGGGARAYAFDRGVVTPCDKGTCRCRINSLGPAAHCDYLASLGGDRAACLASYQGEGASEAWRRACVANHERAMNADHNDHFRAKALAIGRAVDKRCAARTCEPAQVVMFLEKELGL